MSWGIRQINRVTDGVYMEAKVGVSRMGVSQGPRKQGPQGPSPGLRRALEGSLGSWQDSVGPKRSLRS